MSCADHTKKGYIGYTYWGHSYLGCHGGMLWLDGGLRPRLCRDCIGDIWVPEVLARELEKVYGSVI